MEKKTRYTVTGLQNGATYYFAVTAYDGNGLESAYSAELVYTNIADSDGDGVPDDRDAFPLDPNETLDTDGDGVGNNADIDDDNDGMPDAWETLHGLNPLRMMLPGSWTAMGSATSTNTIWRDRTQSLMNNFPT